VLAYGDNASAFTELAYGDNASAFTELGLSERDYTAANGRNLGELQLTREREIGRGLTEYCPGVFLQGLSKITNSWGSC
jgi:hypothetical protein